MEKSRVKAGCRVYFSISIVAFFIHFGIASTSSGAVVGKVTSVEGRYMELDIGADKGIKVGDVGRVYYTVRIEGKDRPIHTARFKVTHISQRSCMAQIEDKTGDVRIGLLAEILPGPSELEISSVPSGATVYVNGKPVGTTPYEGKNVSPGSHKVRMEKEGYEPWEKQVAVEAGKRKEVVAELVLLKIGEIEVKSEPAGAKVYLDGKGVGETPLTVSKVSPGRHRVQVVKEGYTPHEESLEVKAREKTRVEVSLRKPMGGILVAAEPAGANVVIDGNRVGVSPYEGKGLAPGKHRVRVEKEGFEAWEKEVMVKGNEQAQVTVKLRTIAGAVVIRTEPSGASIYIDGGRAGVSPYETRDLSPGRHKVRVEKEGYEPWEGEVTVVAEKSVDLPVRLKVMAGELVIESEPAGAKAYLNGKEIGTTPIKVSGVAPGTYNLRVVREGYAPHEEKVRAETGKSETVRVSLRKPGGNLVIRTEPPGANVFIDGKSVGVSPYEGKNVPPGTYKVRVEKEGYESWEGQVAVETGKAKETLARLNLKAGEIEARSEPTGGRVFLDGKEAGETPLVLKEVVPGRHRVRIAKEGYDAYEESIEVKAREKTRVDVSLKRQMGGLLVRTEPAGANVYVDGNLAGVTPQESKGLVPGSHRVRVEKEGYEVSEKEVMVKANERVEVSVSLKRVLGSLVIQTEPTRANVYIDGKSVGLSPHEAKEVSPGSHRVRVIKEGYEVWEKEVIVEAGKKEEIRSQLVKLEVLKKQAPLPVSPPKTALLTPERPIWNIDDSWRYVNQEGKGWEIKVVRIEKDLVIVKNSSDGSLVGIDKNSLEEKAYVTSMGRKVKDTEIGDFSFKFPLEAGKKWSTMVTYASAKTSMSPGNFLNEYRVITQEDIAVPAGTFRAYKIELNQTHVSGSRATMERKRAYIWYSPEIKREVKVHYEGPDWGKTRSFELASYKLN
ncbi:MAG: PEGA domain-containing protein [Deltaproteobacteria bacterium]|nr:MAG: PEGA domain-containing protein [Deltaproteobacteria bacterium]